MHPDQPDATLRSPCVFNLLPANKQILFVMFKGGAGWGRRGSVVMEGGGGWRALVADG